MRINNAIELYHFVRNNQLVNMAPEIIPLIQCIDELNRMCVCDPIEAKNTKSNQCRSLYIAFASKSQKYKNIMFNKINDSMISFYINEQQIITLSR